MEFFKKKLTSSELAYIFMDLTQHNMNAFFKECENYNFGPEKDSNVSKFIDEFFSLSLFTVELVASENLDKEKYKAVIEDFFGLLCSSFREEGRGNIFTNLHQKRRKHYWKFYTDSEPLSERHNIGTIFVKHCGQAVEDSFMMTMFVQAAHLDMVESIKSIFSKHKIKL